MSGAANPAPRYRLVDGAVLVFAAELLLLPTGLVTAGILTRTLGAAGYGLFSLAATVVTWVAWSSTSLFARTAIKFVTEAEDWGPVATSVLRWRLGLGAVCMGLVAAAATPIAHVLHEPEIAPYLRVFALDLLLFNVARAYREVLTGLGRFREVAVVAAVRWTVRMLLVSGLVLWTGSIMGAVVASVGATAAELIAARRYQQILFAGPARISRRDLWSVAAPLLVFGVALQLHNRVDLFALSAFGGSPALVGHYAAAQNLAVAPGLFSLAFSPLLLASLGRHIRQGATERVRLVARDALRVAVGLTPFAFLVAATSGEIVELVFGAAFRDAGRLLALLFAAGITVSVSSVAASIAAAVDHQRTAGRLGLTLVTLAITGHLMLIPRWGADGAAAATALSALVVAMASLRFVYRTLRISAFPTLARGLLIGGFLSLPALYWTTPGAWLVLKLALLSAATLAGYRTLGEFTPEEWQRIRGAVGRVFPSRGGGHNHRRT